ncbi:MULTISPECIES: glutathione S-transferase family protein [unclassified Beijerinckia]|uniref:glutathione S-transferase family protein n=1 Tax=unclassified Beijerinckia TaxID=2638183 RepID=UPI000896C5D9|nr:MULTISPECIES: glutathione S-transferase family protein [unclassified Beijerinckia]SEC95941.1 glutathione S-transferase [Beijerinckia sp. 28-YEA-48]
MPVLFHHPLCPHSRFIRIALAEYGLEPELIEERAFERRNEFLMINPAAETPVLVEPNQLVVPGVGNIAEYLDETHGASLGAHRLLPQDTAGRVEVRRLMDWFNGKFFAEVSNFLVTEKVYKRYMTAAAGGGAPDMDAVRAGRANIRYHMAYIGWLTSKRKWLAGDMMTYADLAAAAHLSCADYLGDVPWAEDDTAKEWYARIKSRPSFRALLNDRVPGMAPGAAYANLDF